MDWIENLGLSGDLYYLCQKLQPVIRHESIQLCYAIPVNKWLAITLWCLAAFSMMHCVCVIAQDLCKAIISTLQKIFIKFLCGEDRKTATEGFKFWMGVIRCVGSIDGCHIP